MAHKEKGQTTESSLHPLDALLRGAGGERESTLQFLARWVSGDWDRKSSGEFKKAIRTKIKDLKYRPPDSKSDKGTFEQILNDAGALHAFQSLRVLTVLEKWFLLNKVLQLERKYRSERRMVSGYPAQFHRSLMTEIQRHFDKIHRIAREYESENGIRKYGPMVFRVIVRQCSLLVSFRRPQPWTKLLKEINLHFSPRDEEVAIRVRVFGYLKAALKGQCKDHAKVNLSDQFLRALTLLVMAGPDATSLYGADALRQAVKKRTLAGIKSEKSSKNS